MTDDAAPSPTTVCPECGAMGRKVGTVTLEALLTEDARARLGDSRSFRFCCTSSEYFGQEGAFVKRRFMVLNCRSSVSPK
jgi:hypothetical protein